MSWDSDNYKGSINSDSNILRCDSLPIPNGRFPDLAEHLRSEHWRRVEHSTQYSKTQNVSTIFFQK